MDSLCLLNKVEISEDQFPLNQKQTWQDYSPDYCKSLFENYQKYCSNYSPYEQTSVHKEPLAVRAVNLPFMTTTEVDNFPRNPYWPENPSPEHILNIQDPYLRWFYLTFRPESLFYYDLHHNDPDEDD